MELFWSAKIAFWFGVLHALEPGHGKAATASYMVGGRRTFWDALIIGFSGGASHSLILIVLALLLQFFAHGVSNEKVHLGIELGTSLLLVGVGLAMLFSSRKSGRGQKPEASCHASHSMPEDRMPRKMGYGVAALVGLAGGALPCPTALGALMAGVALGKVEAILNVVLFFGLGLALALTLVAASVRFATVWMKRWEENPRFRFGLSLVRGALFLGIGIYSGTHVLKQFA